MSNIRVQINTEADLFEPYDADHNTLREGFVAFLKRRIAQERDGETPVVHIVSPSPVDEERVRSAILRMTRSEIDMNRLQRRRNRWIELYLFLLGVACIVAGLLLKDVNVVYLQILSLTAGFAIKEAATIFFMKNPKNTLERARLMFLARTELRFERQDSEAGKL